MSMLLRLCFSLVLLAPALVHAATLENPANGSFYSGIGVISGWKCEANGPLTVRFNGGAPIPLAYGNERGDVRNAGACPSAQVGFVSIMNWAELGDGTHTAVVYDNGVAFARSTFTVATTGEPFVTGAEGECRVPDFPAPGETMAFAWNEATQHLEMVSDSDERRMMSASSSSRGSGGPAALENPASGSFYSGIGVISGWKCTATGPLTVRFNGGAPIPLAYGNERGDVRNAGACPSAQVGFVSIMNWAELGDGTHTAVAYDAGVEFARSTFTVATTGEPFVTGAEGECRVPDFPAPDETMLFAWNEATQHLEMVNHRGGGGSDDSLVSPPANLRVTEVGVDFVVLAWDAPEWRGALSYYNIYSYGRSDWPGMRRDIVSALGTRVSRVWGTVSPNHCYRVSAVSVAAVESEKSAQVCVDELLGTPRNLRMTAVGLDFIDLEWDPLPEGGMGSYAVIQKQEQTSAYIIGIVETNSVRLRGIGVGLMCFTVRAVLSWIEDSGDAADRGEEKDVGAGKRACIYEDSGYTGFTNLYNDDPNAEGWCFLVGIGTSRSGGHLVREEFCDSSPWGELCRATSEWWSSEHHDIIRIIVPSSGQTTYERCMEKTHHPIPFYTLEPVPEPDDPPGS